MDRYPNQGSPYPLLLKRLLAHPKHWCPDQQIHFREHAHSYAEFAQRVARLAHVLRVLGVRPGDAVGVLDWCSHRYLELFFAVPMCGAVLHTVNYRLAPEQVLFTINHAEDVVLFVHEDFAELVGKLKPVLTTVRSVVEMGDPWSARRSDDYETRLAQESATYDFPEFDEDTVATTFYTTGTTGDPKGVFFTHRQLMLHTLGAGFTFAAFGDPYSFRQDDVYMPLTPMFHVHAWGFPFIATLLGTKQVYPGRYEPRRLVQAILDHKVTVTHGVPTMLHMLVTQATADGVRFDGLKMLIGGSALSRGLCERALERGILAVTGYGMSETCPVIATGRVKPAEAKAPMPDRIDLVRTGLPLPLVEFRIQDENGSELPAGETHVGELLLRGPWLTAGYSRNPEASQHLWRDGWMHTGDVAYRDETGYLHLTDRLKDVIKTSGEWVSSIAIENLLSQHGMVSEVAVVGAKDERWGERPVAFVVLRPEAAADTAVAALREHLQALIAAGSIERWALLTDIRLTAGLPKTSVGKLNKRALRASLAV